MVEMLDTQPRRRTFFLISGLSLAAMMSIRLLTPLVRAGAAAWWAELLSWALGLLDELIPGVMSAMVAVGVVPWLWPQATKKEVTIVAAKEINENLKEPLGSTKRMYWFRGRTASFATATMLPQLVSRAQKSRDAIDVHIQVIDPSNELACSAYASYYNKTIKGELMTTRDVQLKILGHILAVYRLTENTLVRPHVTLLPFFSLYRIDLSERHMMLTQEDREEAALRCDADTSMYDLFLKDMIEAENQGVKLPEVGVDWKNPSTALAQTKISLKLDEGEVARVTSISDAPKDPYSPKGGAAPRHA